MEFLYEEMFKYKNATEKDKDVLYELDDNDIDITKCQELYTLYIDDVPIYVAKFLLPLVKYLTTQKWTEINWYIIPIKN